MKKSPVVTFVTLNRLGSYLTCAWIPDIEYEACQSFDQLNCNTTNGCDWEIDIQYGSCSNLGSSSCDATPGCWGAYTNPGWYYGWYCAGGTYIISDNSYCSGDIDNGYCTEAYALGDVNLDGAFNVIDIVELVSIILNAEYIISGDLNQDGVNNIVDSVAYMQVKDLTKNENEQVFIFNGWTFASDPSLTPFDHAIYDIQLLNCSNA